MTECWTCKNNRSTKTDGKKVIVEFRCRLGYTTAYMEMHETIKKFKCPEYDKIDI